MELRRFRYFVAVAEELHFRRAAERLHLAQPALSQQVRKLEVELGVELLHRTKRGVALTAAGTVFLDEARRLLRQADEAARTARNARTGAAGRLRLGHVADAVPAIVPRAIAAFASRYPEVEIVPETAPARRAVEDVRTGRLDLAVVGLPLPTTDLKVTPLAVESTVVAVPDRHLLSGRPMIALRSLAETPLILLPRATNPAFHDAVIAGCRAAAISPTLIDTAESQVEHALVLVASGMGVALLPASVADRYKTVGVSFRPLAPPAPTIELVLVARPEPAALIAGFLRVVRELDRPRRATSTLQAVEAPLPLSA
jgi:DNA-binding transcriptional LysR family regulator